MKIHIFGASGSGVTTLGEALAGKLKIPYFDSDVYFWEQSDPPFTIRRNPQERNLMIQSALQMNEHWILGGSIIHWGENVFPDFDLVVFLWIPPDIRIKRLETREIEKYGTVILDNPERKKQFEKFINWALDYDANTGIANRTLKAHEEWLNQITYPILRIKGDTTIEERIGWIVAKLEEIN